MSAREDLIVRLAPDYGLVPSGDDAFDITSCQGEAFEPPIRLELEDVIFEEYVDRLLRSSGEPDRASAIGLVRVHLEEAIESASAVGQPVTALGVRRGGVPPRPRWFVDRMPQRRAPRTQGGPSLEWRA